MVSNPSAGAPMTDDEPHAPPNEVDTTLPRTVSGWQDHFRDGLNELEFNYGEARRHEQREEMTRLLDAAVGIECSPSGRYRGITLTSRKACVYFPVALARALEYESAARKLNASEVDIGAMHTVLGNTSLACSRTDVAPRHVDYAIEYLMRALLSGNRFAKRVLDVLSPSVSHNLHASKTGGRAEYFRAIRDGDRERAVQLGRVLGGGGVGHNMSTRPDATAILKMTPRQQKAMAANNIGYLLLHGIGEVKQDIRESLKYYEMAYSWGSAAAASNLGFVYYHGMTTFVPRDGVRAKKMYAVAIERGERNFAPRNMAILLYHGAKGVKADIRESVRFLLLGIEIGEDTARAKCRKSLRIIMRSWRFRFVRAGVRKQCLEAADDFEDDGRGMRYGTGYGVGYAGGKHASRPRADVMMERYQPQ